MNGQLHLEISEIPVYRRSSLAQVIGREDSIAFRDAGPAMLWIGVQKGPLGGVIGVQKGPLISMV
ncbi:hypothetical protein V475_16060 [Sphingobium baderi LL03]|uniref:Uncharacterized protein n=1 Tax=Sphingobium baderi LL03 TaxID=1114964 RepID=T0G798_9SPHN|nr:hypothetical protein L485_24850 [Sphingobium baderi LL03]KMS61047.1 hypothetical protein V475_16060 [Sphingobium baderi LL03]